MCSARISEYGGSMTKADRVRASVLDEQLCFALYTASRAMTSCYRPMLDAIGLTYPQFLVLLVLWERGDTSVTGIGNALQLETGTLSPLLKRLETTGFITRTRQAGGRAVGRSSGSPRRAGPLEERAAAVQHEVSDATGLTDAEIVALRATLHTLTAQPAATDGEPLSGHAGTGARPHPRDPAVGAAAHGPAPQARPRRVRRRLPR